MLAATPGATAAAAARERRRASLGEDWSSESPPAGAAAFGAATDASPASPPTSSASLPPAAALLADRLWDRLVIPRILEPLAALAAGLDGEAARSPSSPSSSTTPPPPPPVSLAARAALHAAQVLFQAAPDPAVAGAVAGALFRGRVRATCGDQGGRSGRAPPPTPPPPPLDDDCPPQPHLTRPLEARAARGALAALLCRGDGALAAAAVGAAVAASRCGGVSEGDLEAVGLLPAVRRKQRDLLGRLVGAFTSSGDLSAARRSSVDDGEGLDGSLPAPSWGDALAAALASPSLLPPSAARSAAGAVAALAARRLPGAPAELTPATAAALGEARGGARGGLAAALAGPWGDVLPALIAAEWAPTRKALLDEPRASVPASAAAVAWREAAADACCSVSCEGRVSGAASALAALRAAQASVLLSQLTSLLECGAIPAAPPRAVVRAPPPADVAEGGLASLLPGAARSRCAVAFARGAERAALLGVGLPAEGEGSGGAGVATTTSRARPPCPSAVLVPAGEEGGDGAGGAGPTTTTPVPVLSAAPLLGASATPDPRQPAWLHIEVRPPARGLLRAAKAGGPRPTGAGLASALVDGKWVLAFPDGEAALAAAAALGAAAEDARGGLRSDLAELLLEEGGGGESGAVEEE